MALPVGAPGYGQTPQLRASHAEDIGSLARLRSVLRDKRRPEFRVLIAILAAALSVVAPGRYTAVGGRREPRCISGSDAVLTLCVAGTAAFLLLARRPKTHPRRAISARYVSRIMQRPIGH